MLQLICIIWLKVLLYKLLSLTWILLCLFSHLASLSNFQIPQCSEFKRGQWILHQLVCLLISTWPRLKSQAFLAGEIICKVIVMWEWLKHIWNFYLCGCRELVCLITASWLGFNGDMKTCLLGVCVLLSVTTVSVKDWLCFRYLDLTDVLGVIWHIHQIVKQYRYTYSGCDL